MSEVHVTIKSDSSGNALKFDNPAVVPLAPNAGQAVTVTAGSGTHGTVNNGVTNVPQTVFNNPA